MKSPSGLIYQVEARDLATRALSCTCPDFRTAGLGTCKHVEATLIWLKRRRKGDFRAAETSGSPFIDIVADGSTLKIERNLSKAPAAIRMMFDGDGYLAHTEEPENAFDVISRSRSAKLRISQDVAPFLESRCRVLERRQLRRDYETGVVSGRHPEHVPLHPLYPYQREGMLHLAFGERALLADEMGLGKTTWLAIQQLATTGLLTLNTRATRHLTGDTPPEPQKPALTPEQVQRIANLRAFAAKKQKVAKLLIESELPEEAEPHQKVAEKALKEAAGIEAEGIMPQP